MVRINVSSSPSVKFRFGQDASPAMTVELGRPIYINGKEYQIGAGLKLDTATNTLSVDAADAAEEDNTLPITSAAVYSTVGNIEVLLKTI